MPTPKSLEHSSSRSNIRALFAANLWMLVERGINIVSTLFVGIWVARYLGPSGFGLLSYCLAAGIIFSSIAKLGLDQIVVSALVKKPASSSTVISTGMLLRLVASLLVFATVISYPWISGKEISEHLGLLIVSFGVILQCFSVIEFSFQADGKFKTISLCRIAQSLISSGLKIALVLNQAEVFSFVWVFAIDQLTIAIMYLWAYKIKHPVKKSLHLYNANTAKSLIQQAWPLLLSGLSISLFLRIDQIMIRNMLGDDAAGFYSAAVRINETSFFIPVVILTVVYPFLIRARQTALTRFPILLKTLLSVLVLLGLMIALTLALLSPYIITLLFGEQYTASIPVLSILAWATPFVFIGVAASHALIIEGLNKVVFVHSICTGLLNIVLNSVLIPTYGISGAAVASLICVILNALVFDLFYNKTWFLVKLKLHAILFPKLDFRT